jgi:putative tryptophan/tyrosine transport system substrate-binding protein
MKKAVVLCLLIALLVLGSVGCNGTPAQPETYKIGILQLVDVLADVEEGFKAGMTDLGYTEGEKVNYLQRNAQGNMDDLQRFAHEFVDEKVDLIVSITTPSSVTAMKASEGTGIPVVFIMVSDPVGAGLVEHLTKPGGRVTGIIDGDMETVGKRLELLLKIAPETKRVLSVYSYEEALLPAEENLRQAAMTLGVELVERQVHTTDEARAAFRAIQPGEADAIFLQSDGLIVDAQDAILEVGLRDRLPQVGPGGVSQFAVASYGANFHRAGVQGASLADKILKGADPASVPVELPRKFDLILNRGIAEKMGLTIPVDVLGLADEVVE